MLAATRCCRRRDIFATPLLHTLRAAATPDFSFAFRRCASAASLLSMMPLPLFRRCHRLLEMLPRYAAACFRYVFRRSADTPPLSFRAYGVQVGFFFIILLLPIDYALPQRCLMPPRR